jgi:hypothetical protein
LLTVIGMLLYYAVEVVERLFIPSALVQDTDPTKASM